MAKKKTDMSVFDRMISGNESEPEQPEEKTEQLPGQMEISDFTGDSVKTAAEPAKKQAKKSVAFRADPELLRKAKIYAVTNGVTLESVFVDALENKLLLSSENLKSWSESGEIKERTVKIKMTSEAQNFLSWYAKQGGITEAEQLRQLLDIKLKEEYAKREEDYKEDLRRAAK